MMPRQMAVRCFTTLRRVRRGDQARPGRCTALVLLADSCKASSNHRIMISIVRLSPACVALQYSPSYTAEARPCRVMHRPRIRPKPRHGPAAKPAAFIKKGDRIAGMQYSPKPGNPEKKLYINLVAVFGGMPHPHHPGCIQEENEGVTVEKSGPPGASGQHRPPWSPPMPCPGSPRPPLGSRSGPRCFPVLPPAFLPSNPASPSQSRYVVRWEPRITVPGVFTICTSRFR